MAEAPGNNNNSDKFDSDRESYLSRFPMDPDVARLKAVEDGTFDAGFEQYNSDINGVANAVAIDLFSGLKEENTFAEKFEGMVDGQLSGVSHSEKLLAKVTQNILRARRDVARLLANYNILKGRFPDEFEAVMSKHSKLAAKIDSLIKLLDWLVENSESFTDEELKQKIEEYNKIALSINTTLKNVWREEAQGRKDFNIAAARGELGFDEESLGDAEKAELRKFAKDLWKELFPDGYVDTFVKGYTGQEELRGYQELLIAPAKGFEYAGKGLVSLVNPDTYTEDIPAAYDSLKTMVSMSEDDWLAMLGVAQIAYENLDSTEMIAPVISLIVSMIVLGGGIKKVQEMASKMGYSRKFVLSLTFVAGGAKIIGSSGHTLSRTLPLGLMTGIALPYFNI